jgi:hypothetical protein
MTFSQPTGRSQRLIANPVTAIMLSSKVTFGACGLRAALSCLMVFRRNRPSWLPRIVRPGAIEAAALNLLRYPWRSQRNGSILSLI